MNVPFNEIERQKKIAATLKNVLGGRKAAVHTFGCQQNEADGERLMGWLKLCGMTEAASDDEADIIILNTCAIREHAEMKELSHTGVLKQLKEKNPSLLIGVCGCMPQQQHRVKQLKNNFPYVDFVFGTDMNHRLPEILRQVLERKERVFSVSDLPHGEFGVISENTPVVRGSDSSAWVSIMYGCNNFCTYCIVPYVRGHERSRDSKAVLDEVRQLVEDGYKDITLLGQNVNSYSGEMDFPDLLNAASSFDGEYRVHFMTSHPKDASDKLIRVIADNKRISRHFHLPVQSGSDAVLKAMNRRYTRESYIQKAMKLREAVPDIAITTDIIDGFPSETEQDFLDTVRLVREVGFDAAYAFIYSPRKGTVASSMPDQIEIGEAKKRFAILSEVVGEEALKRNEALIGSVQRVLSEGGRQGRSDQNKIVCFDLDVPKGTFVDVKIRSAIAYQLRGTVVE